MGRRSPVRIEEQPYRDPEGTLVGDTAVEALAGENGEFGFRHVEPTVVLRGVMPFEPLGDAPRLGGWERLVERAFGVGVEVVLYEDDFLGLKEMGVH